MKNLPWHSKLVLALIIFLPLYFIVAALGTKFGIWSWQVGLVAMVFRAGIWVLGVVAVVSIISLIVALIRKPRSKIAIGLAAIGLLFPAGILAAFSSAQGTAAENPIHDISTDTGNPPAFSEATLKEREDAGANPINDYQTPLGEIEMWKGSDRELAIQSHAQVITNRYPELTPLPLGGHDRSDAVAAVAAAMAEMGMTNIREDEEEGRVEGVAETFWYGFKDDVVARVGENEIDFRSVSRVGRSDLGANSKRIKALREATAARIGQR